VAKVKKRTGVRGERNARGKSAAGKKNGTKKAGRGRAKKRGTSRKKAASRKEAKPLKSAKPANTIRVAVKSLDPLRKCGPKTTVQFLYRVDEQVDGRSTAHLVFFDRHGWYCEHGRSCPAVGHARKFNGQIARVS
jgi:hypothetical protein